jgi:DNA-binding NtrC family response regulator
MTGSVGGAGGAAGATGSAIASAKPRILIADDQPDVLEALRLLLKSEGMASVSASSPAEALAEAERREVDAVLIDLNYARDTTSGEEGLDLLDRLRQLDPNLPVVVMTAWGSVDVAVEAMRRGARDFVQKPWENARLLATLRSQIELGAALRRSRRLEAENRALRAGESSVGRAALVAESAAMRPVLELLERVGPSDASVLLTGENGTGKSLLARALHDVSVRRGRTFVSVNVGGLAESVFESELFGHVRGAFTDAKADRVGRFELADGGTLFLDEIGNVSLGQQAKLLRVLESGEFEPVGSSRTRTVDVRVVSATNADLEAEVSAGRFRRDLLFRLRTVEIRLPPLRERREDIPLLAASFLSRHANHYRKPIEGFSPEALKALLGFPWPGNVRELDHAVERAVLMTAGKVIEERDLALRSAREASPSALDTLNLDEVERLLVRKTLARHDGNVSRAAEDLGISRAALYRRIEKHGLG